MKANQGETHRVPCDVVQPAPCRAQHCVGNEDMCGDGGTVSPASAACQGSVEPESKLRFRVCAQVRPHHAFYHFCF